MTQEHYYFKKYPYCNYHFITPKLELATMFTVPVSAQVEMYQARLGAMPKSFFDCGCATGELIKQASNLGLDARGIDIQKYPMTRENFIYVQSGRMQYKSILDCEPVEADLAFANGTLTYFTEQTLPLALSRFKNVRMLIAIHNTTEDFRAAQKQNQQLLHNGPRLIKTNAWWMNRFSRAGFNVEWDKKYGCFCAIPNVKTR